ncbi:hypothetical protein DLREEDagr8_22810 [Dongia sp. agr-C8]
MIFEIVWMNYILSLAAGFAVGFFIPSRNWVLVPVATIAVNLFAALYLGGSFFWVVVLINIVVAYSTALSINRFMYD